MIGWDSDASWLAGIALSTTSVAVVYAVMLEFGLNRTDYGKVVLAARFVNDLATVLALGFKFSPFTFRTLVFAGGSGATFVVMPWLVPRFFSRYGGRPSELEAKLLLLVMFGLAALALWAGSEPVLPAYVLGMILASTVGRDHALVRRLRTLTLGLLTPFYFIRAGAGSADSIVNHSKQVRRGWPRLDKIGCVLVAPAKDLAERLLKVTRRQSRSSSAWTRDRAASSAPLHRHTCRYHP